MLPTLEWGSYYIVFYDFFLGLGWGASFFYFLHFQNFYSKGRILLLSAGLLAFSSFGSRLFFFLFSKGEISWSLTLLLPGGGSVFYGGLLGGLLFLRGYHYFFNDNLASLVPGGVLGHGLGRIGCYFAGCCYGMPIWGISIPVQLIEAIFLLGLYKILHKAFLDGKNVWVLYLSIYPTGRFLLEFLRGDEIRGIWLLSTSQWVSLLLLLGVALHQHTVQTLMSHFPMRRRRHHDGTL